MKKLFTYLMVMATLLIGGGKAMAQTVTIDGVVYTLSGDHAYVSGNSGIGDTVVVLGKVTINEVEYPVTEIGYRAFYRTTQVLAYTLPDGITSIGTEAFYDNYALKTINLPSSIETIGHMAFGYNWDVQITELPANLKTLDTEAFRGCQSATFTKIPDGVTHIPNGAFRGCYSLTSLELPKGLTRIDDYAFEGCTALTTVNIPAEAVITHVGTSAFGNTQVTFPEENGIRYLGSVAYELTDRSLTEYVIKEGTTVIFPNLFADCTNMTSITIPNSVVSIGEYAFSGCTGLPIDNGIRYADCYAIEVINKTLTEYTLKDNVRFLGNALFQDCSAMTTVTIPSGVIEIGNHAFAGCSALTSITLPESLTSIGSHAFYTCSSLTSVDIPSRVTEIGNHTFAGSALTSITLPESLTSIGSHAFYMCSSLTSVDIPSRVTVINDYTFQRCRALVSMTLSGGVTSIGNGAFDNCSALTTVTLSPSLTSIASDAFYECIYLHKIINYSNLPLTRGSSNYGYVAYYAQQIINVDTIIDGFWFDTDANGKHHLTYYEGTDSILTLPSDFQDGNYGIDANVFSGHNEIVSIQFPDGITSIGASAFSGCSALTSLTLPESVASIGSEAFYNCSSLTSLTLPDGVTSIGESAFYGCSSLTSVNIPSGVIAIGANTFNGCSSLTSLTLPDGVTSIGTYAFFNCSLLTSMAIPASVMSIDNHAFEGCTGVKELTIADAGEALWLGYNGTDNGLFTPCNLEKLYLGRNLSYSTHSYNGYSPFYNIQTLKDVVIGDSVTTIGFYAFCDCDSITTVRLPESVISISDYAFYLCRSLASIYLPNSLTSIGQNAFNQCGKLITVTLPENLISIGSQAFRDCNKLQKIINYSDLQLTSGSTNYGYVAYYAQQVINVDTIIDGYWFDTDANGKHHLTYYEGTDSVLTLPADYQGGNYCVDGGVFRENNKIISIQLPEAVDSIGTSAFYNCSSLATINIPSGISTIAGNTFEGCSALTILSLPETVTSIGAQAFYNCSALTSVNIPSIVTSIGANAFAWCSSLTSLVLPETIASIGGAAFYNCSSLTSINIPSGLTKIEYDAFNGCSSLSSMTIPASVTSIGNNAFDGCIGLKELILADGSETLSLGYNGYNSGQFTPCKLEKLYIGRNLSYNTNYNYGYSPFYNIQTLKEVVLGDSLSSIGGVAFYECRSLTYVHCGFESPQVLSGNSLREQAVIYVPKGTYVAYKEVFPNNIIVDGEANEVIVDVTIPGTLGEEALNQVAYLRDVHSLKVSGTLNNDDLSTITGSMVNLLHLDLSKVNMTSVSGIGHANLCSIVFPDSCKYISGYDNRENLTSVTLPDAVETLGQDCFNSCDQLAEVTMSANLKTVGASAFRGCSKLKEITFKDRLESIGTCAFFDCGGLKTVSLGAGDKFVGYEAFRNCGNLNSVSLGTGVTRIHYCAFYWCSNLRDLVIGDGILVSGWDVFTGCSNLTKIHIPNIEVWLNSSFPHEYYDGSTPNQTSFSTNLYIDGELVTDVVIPSSVTSIRPYVFSHMSGITSVTIPESVTTISEQAFYDCSSLASVTMADGVTWIGANAFASCDSLKAIILPSTLSNCAAGAFSGCGLTEVTCPAFFPPVTGGDVIGANNCTLYVPEWTLNRYKLANNWNLFAAIEPISGIYPSTISVYTEEGLTIPAEGLAEGYTPNLEIVRYDASNVGRLTLRGEKAMPLSTFKMEQTRDAGTMTSLVNYGTLTADSVAIELSISANNWHYLTFPYDVKIADIATLGDWVIRRYDGASRARADFSSTWQNVPYDSILHAGEGYIWYSTNGNFTVPSIENDNRNLIFANDARYTQLKEHASATEANYGWNLIGNPYPCFYDTRFMEFSSPITVRSGNSYAAYSPVDDSYILSPLEAFFVQCSADNNVVGFTTEGRQTDNTVRTLTSAPSSTRSAAASRSVLNLYLENGSYADHTRLVVNESASMDYEIACDAAKFMSEDNSLPQLFTFVNNERMAINERPLADGKVALGVYIGKTGSYTLSLDTRATDTEVYLIDKYSGTETDLNSFSYDFTAEAGTYNDRFEIVMKRIGETAITEEATAAVKVMGTTGAINILNATAPIYVYNAAGALVATQHGGDVTIEVAPGVYVVKVGDEIHKVSVIK